MFYENELYDFTVMTRSRDALDSLREKLSSEIRALRRECNISHRSLVQLSGLSRSTISRIENNSTAYSIENALILLFSIQNFIDDYEFSPITTTILNLWSHCSSEEKQALICLFSSQL